MTLTKCIVVALALVAALWGQTAEGARPARCKSYFQLLERQRPNGPRHTPLYDIFDPGFREVDGQPLPNKELRFHNKLYKGCGSDSKTAVIVPSNRAGHHQGHCIEVYAPLKLLECYFTWVLDEGTISTQGPYNLETGKGTQTVTGGSGKYFGVKGEVDAVLGGAFPSQCNVPTDLKPLVNTYTFCLNKPALEV